MALRLRPLASLAAGLAACGPPLPSAQAPPDSVAAANAALRGELIRLGMLDQTVRLGFSVQILTDTGLVRTSVVFDSILTRRLQTLIATHGWPQRSDVGLEAANAAFLILQHSPSDAFQRRMLPLLEAAAQKDEAGTADVAMLTDRLRTHDGLPQIYGTQFRIVDGALAPFPIEQLDSLEARRARAGLMPMAEYVKLLEQTYQGPVRWPPDAAR